MTCACRDCAVRVVGVFRTSRRVLVVTIDDDGRVHSMRADDAEMMGELLELVVRQQPEYARVHHPDRVRAVEAAVL